MNWHNRFRAMKKELGYENKDIAEMMGNTEGSVRTSTQPNNKLPRGYKLAVCVFEDMKKRSVVTYKTKDNE